MHRNGKSRVLEYFKEKPGRKGKTLREFSLLTHMHARLWAQSRGKRFAEVADLGIRWETLFKARGLRASRSPGKLGNICTGVFGICTGVFGVSSVFARG